MNRALSRSCKSRVGLILWKHDTLCGAHWVGHIAKDGVHVSPSSMPKYFQSIRGSILFIRFIY